LPDGNYGISIKKEDITAGAYGTLASDFTFNFFVLSGDLAGGSSPDVRNRTVDSSDLAVVTPNLGLTGKTIVQGQGSTAADGKATYTYSCDLTSGSLFPYTQEALPLGTNKVYFNSGKHAIFTSLNDPAAGQTWRTYHQYDSAGRLTMTAEPSAVSGTGGLVTAQSDTEDDAGTHAGLRTRTAKWTPMRRPWARSPVEPFMPARMAIRGRRASRHTCLILSPHLVDLVLAAAHSPRSTL
jgi:hypothetical protein